MIEEKEGAMKVFLSFSIKDFNLAKNLKEALKAICDVYIASEDIRPGTPLWKKIEANIRSSNFIIVLMTKNAEGSAMVQQEIATAKANHITVIPVVERGVQLKGILEGIEYIEFDKQNIAVALKGLAHYLRKEKKEKDLSDLLTISLLIGGLFMLIGKSK
ncbi:MAG: toll/interleukin-1 receptor domain-containing protein [Acidobacteriota bacterium]|nr:toll/interleukin-1 receptor domain-containing protein [Acidobacteriota bacterium]